MDTAWWNTVRGVDGISITSTIIQCLLFLPILVITILSIRYIINKELRSYKLLLPYTICIVLILIFCTTTALCTILSSIFMQLNHRSISFHFIGYTLLFYNISLTMVYFLFIFRIDLMLKTSTYKISNQTRIFLFTLAIILCILQCILLYFVSHPNIQMSHNWKLIDILSFISMSIFYLGSTIIIFLFISKLKLVCYPSICSYQLFYCIFPPFPVDSCNLSLTSIISPFFC